ncbi:Transcriptional activator protein acu-15 [Mycena sanguinolenta]|uniref:Transcriptional activator protein acu-15 n=1 Tax=Mycena sanguinolenta TaxID=230812 RepID=A0A8H7CUB2_9AGAR|nr:Transcriptional activator protein acu-15 [Mycena sanguinolenta]
MQQPVHSSLPPLNNGRPTSHVPKACNNCRRRKIRCDGERPICSRCRVQPPRSLTPCTYSHTPVGGTSSSQTELIEGMQNRIDELEHQVQILSGQDPTRVFLSEPYSNQPFNESPLALDILYNSMPFLGTPSSIEEPPGLNETLIDAFLRHFSRHHLFFLASTEFKQSALLSNLLPPGLLNAVVLWANHISANSIADSRYSDEQLLARAVHHVARGVAVVDPSPQRILHMIQAEVLLALYYLDGGRLLEGNYHRAGAASLAFSMGLHQIGSSSQGSYSLNTAQMGGDGLSRTEMIDAFWSVVILNNCFVVASDVPSSIPCDALISTPWPTHSLNDGAPGPFIPGNDVAGHSALTLLANASVQLERTIVFTARNPSLPVPPEFWVISTRLETFRGHLQPVDADHSTDQVTLVTHAFVNVAIIRLYSPHATLWAAARAKCLDAARWVFIRLASARITEWEVADPILGPLLATVADVLIANRNHDGQATAAIQTTLSAMRVLARLSPLVQQYLAGIQQRYRGVQERQVQGVN